jgi:hypothetical protein
VSLQGLTLFFLSETGRNDGNLQSHLPFNSKNFLVSYLL